MMAAVHVDALTRAAVVERLRAAGCVYAEEEAQLLITESPEAATLAGWVQRRCAGEPLEPLLGWAEFCGLRIAVAAGVFVPRRRTGWLVAQALAFVRAGSVVVDLCCGSGAVGAAIGARCPGAEVYAADLDPAAVGCARRNLPARRVFEGDLYEPLPRVLRGRVDLLVVNAPYVPTAEIALMPPEARLHEPRLALDGGADGTEVQARVAAQAPGWLAAGGRLVLECGRAQAPLTADHLRRAGLRAEVRCDEDLDATVVVGSRGPAG
jgi:release factor glutamine methyltransferase